MNESTMIGLSAIPKPPTREVTIKSAN